MEIYQVRIGSAIGPYWGEYTVKTKAEIKQEVDKSIELLHPLNSSDAGAEAYRQRYRGQPIFIKQRHEKEYEKLE